MKTGFFQNSVLVLVSSRGFRVLTGRLVSSLMVCLLVLASGSTFAQENDEEAGDADFSNSFDFQMLGGMLGRLQPHGNDLMGDMIDKKTGGITFEHTDISIPGNSGLEVALRRKLSQGDKYYSPYQQAFGDWVLDLPVAYFGYGYQNDDLEPEFNDGCLTQRPLAGSIPKGSGGGFSAQTIFHPGSHETGTTLQVPGQGLSGFQSEVRTVNNPGLYDPQADWISGGQGTDYSGRCAEKVIAADGTTYKFGRHTYRVARNSRVPALASINDAFQGALFHYAWVALERRYAVYLITEVEDVHGNWVRYEYNDDDELERIYSNDDREINLHYSSESTTRNSRYVSHITAHGRTWTYDISGLLSSVMLPDGRSWAFDMQGMGAEVYTYWNCVPSDYTFSMTHPDGAVGTFTVRETRHVKNAFRLTDLSGSEDDTLVPRDIGLPTETDVHLCLGGERELHQSAPIGLPFYRAMSLVQKTLSSPNIPDANWTFEYRGYADGGPDDDWQNIVDTWTSVTEPDNTERTYRYHANGLDHGLLESIEISSPSGAGETIEYDYDLSQQVDPGCGFSSSEYGDTLGVCYTYIKRPQTRMTRVRDGVTYTTERVYDKASDGVFVDYGRPNQTTRYSTLQSEQRVTEMDYWHNTSANIIGRTERVVRNGKEFARYSYKRQGSARLCQSLWCPLGNL